MRCRLMCFLLLVLPLCSGDHSVTGAEPGGSVQLLDDPSLAAWSFYSQDPKTVRQDVWTLIDGVLVCRGLPKGYLVTKQSYTNFKLTLQWRWPPGKKPGRGGVLIRMTGKNKIWPKSLEAQLNTGDAGDFWGLAGYRLKGPATRTKTLEHADFGKLTNVRKSRNAEKPAGQWNRYEIIAENGTVTLLVNGQSVNQATDCDVVSGPICLTAEGDAIEFRNIQLEPRP